MDYEKMLYYADTNKMSHTTNGNLTPTVPTVNFKVGATAGAHGYLPLSTSSTLAAATAASSTSLTPSQLTLSLGLTDPYAAYADTFDLSLLPQDCASTTNSASNENIPTTVYQYTNDILPTPSPSSCSSSAARTPTTTPPQIKIEQTWACPASADVKPELIFPAYYDQQLQCSSPAQSLSQHHTLSPHPKSPHQLIPPPLAGPPAYRQPYPSPQSSPAQSEYGFPSSQFAGCYDSLSSSRSSLYPSSPCPSIDASHIKQELHILPPSPPESNCEASPPHSTCGEIKSEPIDAEVETLIDLNSLFEKTFKNLIPMRKPLPQQQQHQVQQQLSQQSHPMVGPAATISQGTPQQQHQQNQVLREYLEDNTFQKKHNLKPLALDSFIGDLEEVGHDIEPVISLALEHAKREADETCAKLQISQDPSAWSPVQVHAWLRSTVGQFKLQPIDDLERQFCEDGAALILLSEEEFQRRAPESGSTLHAQLEIWKMAYSDGYHGVGSNNNMHNNANNNGIVGAQQQQQQHQQQQQQQQAQQQATTNQNNASEQTNDGIWSMNCMQSYSMDTTEDDSDDDEDNIVASTSVATAASGAATAVGNVNGAINVNGTTATGNATATNASNAAASSSAAVAGGAGSETTAMTTTTTASTKQKSGRSSGSHIHLWQFLKELLAAPHLNGTAIRWIDRTKGVFKIEDSVRVAKLWGRRKNRPAMNYDKLSRSIRQYYKKGIMKKTERSQRLVYQFCAPYHL